MTKAAKIKKFKSLKPWIGVTFIDINVHQSCKIAYIIIYIYIYIYIGFTVLGSNTVHFISLFLQSIVNHIYWVANTSTSADEKEEKWRSILNHIANIHIHEDNKIYTKCTHGTIERDWLKQGWQNIEITCN